MSNADEIRTVETGVLVRELRRRMGLTQERFAAILGVTLPTINRWENGRSKPSPLAMKNLNELMASIDQPSHRPKADKRTATE
jgi:putative transcriptional regulator